MVEEWRDIKDYQGLYQISNFGRVKSLEKTDRLGRRYSEKLLSICDNGNGYKVVNLKVNGKQKTCTVHRLVATAFIPNPFRLDEINHKDGDKSNNKVENLEWCNRSENVKHAVNTGLHTYFGQRKVQCVETGQIFDSIKEAQNFVGVKGARISNVCRQRRGAKTCAGYHWRYV